MPRVIRKCVSRGIRGRGPYNAPFLTCRFCPSKMGGLKNDCFSETEVDFFFFFFFFDWAMWRAGVKREKSIYDEPPTLGIPRQSVVSMMA